MAVGKVRFIGVAGAISIVSFVGLAQAADNYYFRLRPSVSILNQEPFSVHIDGDRAGVVGSSFSAKAEASSPRETLRFDVTEGNLPSGISLDAVSGSISGQPKVKGLFRATITASDAFSTASTPLEVQVYDALDIDSIIPQYATVGESFTALFKGMGGNQSYIWTMTGTPPIGLALSASSGSTFSLSGIPTTPGKWDSLRVGVVDGAGHSASTSDFSVAVANRLNIVGTPSTIATVGESYSATFMPTGGHSPISWSLVGGQLPSGLKLENGTISGTPLVPGTASGLIVRATDAVPHTADSVSFSINVSQPLSLAGSPSGIATVGSNYSASFTPTGGNGSYSWSIKSGSLPNGFSLASGTVSGTPKTTGTWSNIVVGVVDNDGRVAQSTPFSIVVSDPLVMSGIPSPIATVGTAYSATFTAAGGDENYSWFVKSGSIPPGLTLVNGIVSGTPTTTGTWSDIVLGVNDNNGRMAQSEPFSIVVSDALTLSGSPSSIATVGTSYSATFTVSGGAGGNAWAIASGSLPAGLSFSNGVISGTPTATGTSSNIVIKVTDTNGRVSQSSPFSIVVSDALTLSGSPSSIATVGTSYSASFTASGGAGGNAWAIVSGSLPAGLSFSNGVISGTPTVAGTSSNIVIKVTDINGRVAQAGAFSIVVSNPIGISGVPPWQGTVGVGYGGNVFTANGGTGSYSWAVINGSLPDGLSLSGSRIGGTPSRSGVWSNIVVRVSDSDGRWIDSQPFSIYIYDKMTMDGGMVGSGKVSQYYQSSVVAYGGRGPYSWGIATGSIPSGMTFSNGILYGTPNAAGTWSFVIRAWDQDGRYVDSPRYTVTIAPNIIREPASGEYWTDSGVSWVEGDGGEYGWYHEVRWPGVGTIYFPYGATSVSSGGATYYRGSLKTWMGVGGRYVYFYKAYRTIP